MAFTTIGVGASANDGTGDPARTAFEAINANFGNAVHVDEKGAANGVASLDAGGLVPVAQLPAGGGTGDVVGPASATADHLVAFDGVTGKLVKGAGSTVATLEAATGAAQTAAGAAQVTADTAEGKADAAQVDATQALADALTADGKAVAAQGDATQALADALTADGKAVAAQGDATQALLDAAASVQPGDPLTDLSSGAADSGHVPKADGSGGIAWAAETGGGGGGGAAHVLDFVADCGGVGDAITVSDGSSVATTDVITSASGLFTSGDVGKRLLWHRTSTVTELRTITEVLSATQVRVDSNMATNTSNRGMTWGTDNGPAFQAAFDSIKDGDGSTATTVLIPPGKYALFTVANKNFQPTNPGAHIITFQGRGGNSQIVPCGGINTNLINTNNASSVWRDVTFYGTPTGSADCRALLQFDSPGLAWVDRCDFYGVATRSSGGAQAATIMSQGHLRLTNCRFIGCVTNEDGVVHSSGSVSVENCTFWDVGYLGGVSGSKTSLVNTPAWITVAGAATAMTPAIELRDVRFDEGVAWHVRINPASGQYRSARIAGVRGQVGVQETSGSIYVNGVKHLVIEDTRVGYNTSNENWGIYLNGDIDTAVIRRTICEDLARKIFAGATVGSLLLEDVEYTTLESSAGLLRVQSGGASLDGGGDVLTSPDGTRYRLTVADDGTLSTVDVDA
jgi:hypothetical protein